ncbi:YqaE/Pmp3 family membrane protein [Ferrimonas sediminicola]|uniref:YqaE/Pmp3 family membrane protein n=1 Tax=Ferrimonas sediminicola TaxID=2569538 RepID=A0A4U1BI14_9GAMM|nr:YqaE/Pmp3 family membrane protein [Ferrimonas sediminicola]TKB51060.1 YqaE/Pmp3 family membrane protein [Ferrimonas sediminicola]
MDKDKLLLSVIAILLPPVAVFLHRGMGGPLLLNILLCLLFYLPGILHALWVVNRR